MNLHVESGSSPPGLKCKRGIGLSGHKLPRTKSEHVIMNAIAASGEAIVEYGKDCPVRKERGDGYGEWGRSMRAAMENLIAAHLVKIISRDRVITSHKGSEGWIESYVLASLTDEDYQSLIETQKQRKPELQMP